MQPLVRQYERWAAEAVVARRRRRRMVLARPAKVVVAVLVIMVCVVRSFWRAVGVMSRGSVRLLRPLWTARDGGRSGLVVRAEYRERPCEEALDRARRYGLVTHLLSHPNGRSSNGTFGCRHDRTIPEPAEGAS